MKTIFEKYFETLNEARAARAAKEQELKKQYDCYFCVAVWDARNSNIWEDGKYMMYVVTADIWPDTKI